MTKLLIIRHGQSMANISSQFAGQTDTPLSPLGIKQAEKTAEYITANYNVDVIYASDLSRAYNTAKAVADKTGLRINIDKNLREIFAGEWEMRPFKELIEDYKEEYRIWLEDNAKARCNGGESVEELKFRVYDALLKIAKENDGKTVVIGTHATPVKTFISHCNFLKTGTIENPPWVPNASVTIAEYDNGEFNIIESGICSHLGELTTTLPKGV